MRQASLALVIFSAGLLLAGCNADPYTKCNLGPAGPVVRASIENIGGLAKWNCVDKIHATAVVAFYQDNGQADLDRLCVTMDYKAGTIEVTGQSPTGAWSACVSEAGLCKTQNAPRPAAVICRELLMMMHRTAGPLNLAICREQAANVCNAKIEGVAVVRVGVISRCGRPAPCAYYFDATTSMLRFITAGADEPGKTGTITVYTPRESYMMLPNGLVFPRSFRVVKIGQNVLLSDKPVMEVEFSDVSVVQK